MVPALEILGIALLPSRTHFQNMNIYSHTNIVFKCCVPPRSREMPKCHCDGQFHRYMHIYLRHTCTCAHTRAHAHCMHAHICNKKCGIRIAAVGSTHVDRPSGRSCQPPHSSDFPQSRHCSFLRPLTCSAELGRFLLTSLATPCSGLGFFVVGIAWACYKIGGEQASVLGFSGHRGHN